MQFDSGTWYVIASVISIMVVVIGVMITVISKFVVLNPMSELKKSIDILVSTLQDIKIFIAEQKSHNTNNQAQITEIYSEIDKISDKHDRCSMNCNTQINDLTALITDNRHAIKNHITEHEAFKQAELQANK